MHNNNNNKSQVKFSLTSTEGATKLKPRKTSRDAALGGTPGESAVKKKKKKKKNVLIF